MRVGIVTTWFERGAAYVSRQYRQVLESSCEVFIYARGGEVYAKGDSNWDGDRVFWGRKTAIPWPMAIHKSDFKQWVASNRIDTVIFNEQQWLLPVLWCKEWGVKSVAYVDYYTESTVPFFGIYDLLICNTKRHASVFSWHPQCIYVPWGTDLELFSPQNVRADRADGPVFFHSAGMSPFRKGTDLVLRAFAELNASTRLIIHTQIPLDQCFPKLALNIADLLSSGRLEIITKDVSAPGLYHMGDVYVYPSRLEGIGLTQVEALACGLPIIVPNNAPMNEFVSSETGLLIPVEKLWARADGYYWPQCEVSLDALVSGMQFYVTNFSDIQKFKESARMCAEQDLNWHTNASVLAEVLKNAQRFPIDEKIVLSIQDYMKRQMSFSQAIAHFSPAIFNAMTLMRKFLNK